MYIQLEHSDTYQGQITLLLEKLRERSEGGEPFDDATESLHIASDPAPKHQGGGGHQPSTKFSGKRPRAWECPEKDCEMAFEKEKDLERHRFIRTPLVSLLPGRSLTDLE